MRVRKFSPLQIPAKIVPNTVRFYREVFDLPTEFGINESRHLFFDQRLLYLTKIQMPTQLLFKLSCVTIVSP